MKFIQFILLIAILSFQFNCENIQEQQTNTNESQQQGQEEHQLTMEEIDEQMTLVTACWYLSSLKIKSEKAAMFTSFSESSHKNLDLFNKLQVDLIKECYSEINIAAANGIISDLNDLQGPEGTTYDRYVPNNTYSLEKYTREDADLTLEESDKSLLKIVSELEKDFLQSVEQAKQKASIDYDAMSIFGVELNQFSKYFLIIVVAFVGFIGLKVFQFTNKTNVQKNKNVKSNKAKAK